MHLNSKIFKVLIDQVDGNNPKEKLERAEIEYKKINTTFCSGNFKTQTIMSKVLPLLINKNVRFKELYILKTIYKLEYQNIKTSETNIFNYIKHNLLAYVEGFILMVGYFHFQSFNNQ